MAETLRDGSTVEDPRLGRLPQFDEASREHQVREILRASLDGAPPPGVRSLAGKFWRPGPTLDQQREGQCVSEAVHDRHNGSPLNVRPLITDFRHRQDFYEACQHRDPWPGCYKGHGGDSYGGTSVLAGMQEGKDRGYWGSYRWIGAGSGTLEADIIDTLRGVGGIVLGIPWLQGMYETNPEGLVEVDGAEVGGHSIHAFAWVPKLRLPRSFAGTKPAVAWHNSWGDDYGVKKYWRTGVGFILLDDLLGLIDNRRGEGAVPLAA